MSEMPETIHAWIGPVGNREWWEQQYEENTYGAFYVRADLVAEKDAEIERLRKALDQAIGAASLSLNENIEGRNSYAGYGMWRYESEPSEAFVYGQSATEFFFGCYSEDSPELASYLREKEEKNGN